MLDTKIIEGPWDEKWIYSALRHLYKNVDFDLFWPSDLEMGNIPGKEDSDAIAALPELLEVYKAAKNLVTSNKGKHKSLEKMIKKLDERYQAVESD